MTFEMLKLAAKAAGIDVVRSRLDDPIHLDILVNDSARNPTQISGPWNPLMDDGDAFRLAVKLRLLIELGYLSVQVKYNYDEVEAWSLDDAGVTEIVRDFDGKSGGDAATRKAITRAAAAIGEAMP